jgi:hypothetical protein
MRKLFPNNYNPAPVKSVGRTFVKLAVDYLEERQPRAACVTDIVRCLLLFGTCRELNDAFRKIVSSDLKIVDVKDSFAKESPQFGYRQILVTAIYESPSDKRMICELQLHIAAYVHVREMLHVYYTTFRCENLESFDDFVGPERHAFGHFGDKAPGIESKEYLSTNLRLWLSCADVCKR